MGNMSKQNPSDWFSIECPVLENLNYSELLIAVLNGTTILNCSMSLEAKRYYMNDYEYTA